jgi:hypothetical protein
MDYIKEKILEFVKNNQENNLDSVDILINFKLLNSDNVLKAMFELEQEKFIKREYSGIRAKYVIFDNVQTV